MLAISPIYAGLIALLYLGLSFRVVAGRRAHRISVGDGGEKDMIKRMRTHANCAEYAPIGLILLVMLELQGASGGLIHAAGATLLAGRLLHAFGFGRTPQFVPARIWGMYFTIGSIMAMAITNIALALL